MKRLCLVGKNDMLIMKSSAYFDNYLITFKLIDLIFSLYQKTNLFNEITKSDTCRIKSENCT